MQALIILLVSIPVVFGIGVLCLPGRNKRASDRAAAAVSIVALALTLALSVGLAAAFPGGAYAASITVVRITDELRVTFAPDSLGVFFLAFIPAVWLLGGVFSLEYLHHENNKKRFWGFYLLTLGSLQGLSLSGNLLTVYLFFEMMTLVSMPLVLHTESHEAVMAGLKYLFYSMFGAYMALFGVFVIYYYACGDFVPGGAVSAAAFEAHRGLMLAGVFTMVLGFGAKAGVFPLHAWLPTAHPVAPAPASAVLSAIIVKGGVLAIIRSVYYVFGAEFIRGTWVQTAWLSLAAFTVFMGSMLAYREKVLKKRLAYSTVSQASYIMLGLAALNSAALTGSLLHVLFHAIIKTNLFLCAGAIIYKTGDTTVDKLRGAGKKMPITMWCFTFVSLGLVGIPPFSGFVSKWYLGTGLLESGCGVFSWLGPVVLLVSALLTAGYLLTISVKAFLPGNDFDYGSLKKDEPSLKMLIPMLVLSLAALLLGVFPGGITAFLLQMAETLV